MNLWSGLCPLKSKRMLNLSTNLDMVWKKTGYLSSAFGLGQVAWLFQTTSRLVDRFMSPQSLQSLQSPQSPQSPQSLQSIQFYKLYKFYSRIFGSTFEHFFNKISFPQVDNQPPDLLASPEDVV